MRLEQIRFGLLQRRLVLPRIDGEQQLAFADELAVAEMDLRQRTRRQQGYDDRKQTQQALMREQYFLRMLMDHSPDSIYFKDKKSRFRIGSQNAVKLQEEIGKRLGIRD